jgi:vancomycin resistance protein YoaR
MRGIFHRGWLTWLIIAAAVVLALALAVVLLDAGLSVNKVHSGVSVAGNNVGGMTRAQAIQAVELEVAKVQANPITLTDGSQHWTVYPQDINVQMGVADSVDKAMALTRSGNVFTNLVDRFQLYFTKQDVPLTGALDAAALDALVNKVSAAVDTAPVDAGLKIASQSIVVIEDKSGRAVDKQALRDSLEKLLLSMHATELPVPVKTVQAELVADDTSEAADIARTIISGNVTLKSGDKKWTLTPSQLVTALDFTVQPTAGSPALKKLIPVISSKTAALFLTGIADAVKTPGKDASWTTDGKKATVVPSVNGTALDVQGTLAALNAAALSPTNRVATVVLKESPPKLTTEQATARGIDVVLATFTTGNHGSGARQRNVIRGTGVVDGYMVAPGQTFNFNAVVSSPYLNTPGFWEPAPAIQPDGSLSNEPGGGICQVATTLFNSAFFSGLEIVERHNHSNYISNYPLGRDATVSAGGPNFIFRNDSGHWILIKTYASAAVCTFTIYGTPDGRKVTYTTSGWSVSARGKSVTVVRNVTLNGQTLHHDVFNSFFPNRPPSTTTTSSTTSTTKPSSTTTTTKPPTSTTTTTTKPPTSTTTTTTKPPTSSTTKPTTSTTAKPTTTTAKPTTTT